MSQLLTIPETMRELRLSRSTVYEMPSDGRLTRVKPGGTNRTMISAAEVERQKTASTNGHLSAPGTVDFREIRHAFVHAFRLLAKFLIAVMRRG